MIKQFITAIAPAILVASCVPMKQFNDVKQQNQQCQASKDSLDNAFNALKVEKTELTSANTSLKDQVDQLLADTTAKFVKIKDLAEQQAKLQALNDNLLAKHASMMKENAEESKKMLLELQNSKAALQKREDSLAVMQKSIEKERQRLEKLNKDLSKKNEEISLKDKQVKDLESVLRAKDSAANALKTKISLALKGFEGNGLTVNQRDGKIYVSLDEKLMFESGKFEVNPKGAEAIRKLAGVLEKNPDISILVEGHTDTTGIVAKNWKLSTDRALAISTIILENARIEGKRVTAAGRGQYCPVDVNTTPEGRTKNRRCEIILSPKLDELYKIIEN